MGVFIQVFSLTVVGMVLLIFGYTLFLGPFSPFPSGWFSFPKYKKNMGEYGDPQVCPLCSVKLTTGDLVKTLAFPSITGGRDRLMFIRGCFNCMYDEFPRTCPVCKNNLSSSDYLISRMFERATTRNHVHVLGCNKCKNVGTLAR